VIESLIVIALLLWVFLAIFVAGHAKGHNRSGVFWFLMTLVTGIFGIVIYLLIITSETDNQVEDKSEFDDRNSMLIGPEWRNKEEKENSHLRNSNLILRRRTLAGVAGGIALISSGLIYVKTRPELRIVETTRDQSPDGNPISRVKMKNPESNPASVEITASIRIKRNFSSERFSGVESKTKKATISPESNKTVDFVYDINVWDFRLNRSSFERVDS